MHTTGDSNSCMLAASVACVMQMLEVDYAPCLLDSQLRRKQTAYCLSLMMQNPPRWIVYHELVLTSKEYARTVTEIRPDWLLEIAPHMYSSKDIAADLNKKVPKTQGRAAMDA